jgi:hypothetical protein
MFRLPAAIRLENTLVVCYCCAIGVAAAGSVATAASCRSAAPGYIHP